MQTTIVRQPTENEFGTAPGIGKPTSFAPTSRNNGANATNGGAIGDKGLVEALVHSKVFQDYERAFTEATGLPVALRPVESWQLPHHGKRNEGPFCALMSEKSRACASCLQMQGKLAQAATHEPCTMTCPSGASGNP